MRRRAFLLCTFLSLRMCSIVALKKSPKICTVINLPPQNGACHSGNSYGQSQARLPTEVWSFVLLHQKVARASFQGKSTAHLTGEYSVSSTTFVLWMAGWQAICTPLDQRSKHTSLPGPTEDSLEGLAMQTKQNRGVSVKYCALAWFFDSGWSLIMTASKPVCSCSNQALSRSARSAG